VHGDKGRAVRESTTVAIIGAGIGGLTAAIALDRQGIPVEVYERAPQLNEVGAGIGLWPNAIRVLDRLGVGGHVRALAVPGTSASARTAAGRRLFGMPEDVLHRRYHAPTTAIMRADLQLHLAREYGMERIRLGHEFTGCAQAGDRIDVRFANGESTTAGLLVGADGVWSTVRADVFDDGPPTYRGDTAWRGLASLTADLEPFDDVFETFGRGARFGAFPLSGDRVMWFAGAVARAGEKDGPDPRQELRERFANWHDPIPRLLELSDPERILRNDIYDRPVPRTWSRGRVVLLGDAAHPMGPDLGQGACQAIEDGETLALAVAHHDEVTEALAAYEKVRAPRVRSVARVVGLTGWAAGLRGPVACRVRDQVMAATPSAVRRRQMDAVAGWNPPWS
jgi:FAD-dependent urate hydroxylase